MLDRENKIGEREYRRVADIEHHGRTDDLVVGLSRILDVEIIAGGVGIRTGGVSALCDIEFVVRRFDDPLPVK